MPIWTFIRHGESVSNAEGWFAGQRDTPLTARGRAQAEALREALRDVPFDRVLASDLTRALDTAMTIVAGRGLELVVTPRLRERSCGEWEGRAIDELERTGDLAVFRAFDGRPPGGESLRDLAKRGLAYLAEVDDARLGALVVSHGAFMRAVIGVLDRLSDAAFCDQHYDNCSVAVRDVPHGAFAAALREL
ncbi:MAG TPA: histidine phosphatase family protein [Nannocystaceae bacterium]|nr:histidine phosphatase family protein [Nannocystaceae bacterium]